MGTNGSWTYNYTLQHITTPSGFNFGASHSNSSISGSRYIAHNRRPALGSFIPSLLSLLLSSLPLVLPRFSTPDIMYPSTPLLPPTPSLPSLLTHASAAPLYHHLLLLDLSVFLLGFLLGLSLPSVFCAVFECLGLSGVGGGERGYCWGWRR